MPANFHFTFTCTANDSSSVQIQLQGTIDNESNLTHIVEAADEALLRGIAALRNLSTPEEPSDGEPQ